MWLITLVLTIAYVIWLTRLINFGVNRLDRIAVASETTAFAVSGMFKAMPPEVQERAQQAIERVRREVTEEQRARVLSAQQSRSLTNKIFIGILVVVGAIILLASFAHAAEQTRFYSPNGTSLGTAVPQGQGSTRYYDASGRSLGTPTTNGNTTTINSPMAASPAARSGLRHRHSQEHDDDNDNWRAA